MATFRKSKNIKVKSEVIETPLTDEEKILGMEPEKVVESVCDYENSEIFYKVTNLQIKNKPVTVRGNLVETFIGSTNAAARKELKKGTKSVITKDANGKNAYKIEVVG